jgi:serine/threonine protein kinase
MKEALDPMDSIDGLQPDSLPGDPATREARTARRDPLEGTTLGPGGLYKILQRIGEGGFGTVFMAEQTAPVRRRVAIKILKAGMDTRQVVARFEAERQALAMMDHPHIAKVLDGGESEQGRPYFVMELVRGTPITDFCDREKLDTHARLHLFLLVCRAALGRHLRRSCWHSMGRKNQGS